MYRPARLCSGIKTLCICSKPTFLSLTTHLWKSGLFGCDENIVAARFCYKTKNKSLYVVYLVFGTRQVKLYLNRILLKVIAGVYYQSKRLVFPNCRYSISKVYLFFVLTLFFLYFFFFFYRFKKLHCKVLFT